jgi:hypothetical protein
MSPSENCPDCGGTGTVIKIRRDPDTNEPYDYEKPCHCTKEHDGDGPED